MSFSRLATLGVLAVAAFVAGCASTSPGTSPATTTAPPAPQASTPRPATGPIRVPKLTVRKDCGDCDVKASIPVAIVDAYTRAAAAEGAQVSSTDTATLTIKSYSARADAARFWAGAFAGKDEILAVITHKGRTHEVGDYYRNAFFGIDKLAENVGEQAYGKLKAAP